jgi:membrane protein DedA with SNARE-associated domain
MRKYLAITFGVLTVLSAVIWIVGMLTAAILPWFGGIRAERIGEIGFTIFICGDGFVYGFGWLCRRFSQDQKHSGMGLPGPKRYGNKKPVA